MSELQPEGLVGGRYRLDGELGRGGMAVAHVATDTATGARVALKRLLPEAANESMAQLFECEFHTLEQLRHPRVVRVHDFGREDDGRAYYTMEWLDGGDLDALSPLPHKRVCALLAGVASALSLLHSRRLVHRDVTTRNIRCSDGGQAKLIDFGAVTPFGPAGKLVGTPPFCPPEALASQDLDGRADLYALGAVAYFALTRQHAYRARNFAQLRSLWASPPRPPSHYATDVPQALDKLVMGLLALDPMARPSTAAEVMERLCAIGEIDMDEQLLVQQSYLTTPRLLGRDTQLARVRAALAQAHKGRGTAILVRGAAGMGRSRFAASCALEGKLFGATVARCDAGAGDAPYAAARALALQAAESLPELTESLSDDARRLLFEAATPEHAEDARAGTEADGAAPAADAEPESAAPALMSLLKRAAEKRSLMLVVDDADRIDERSAALLSLLAESTRAERLVLVATVAQEQALSDTPLALFDATARTLKLRALSEADSAALLRSIFGDAAHLPVLCARLHQLAEGCPGAIMDLAQHLLDRGAVRYEAGAWTLPARLDEADLPASIQGALAEKLRRLSPAALRVAQTLSLVGATLALEELVTLAQLSGSRQAWDAVDELVALDVVQISGMRYRLSRTAYRVMLEAALDDAERRALHGRLAELRRQHNWRSWSVVRHLVLAERLDEAVDLMVERLSVELTPAEAARRSRELPDDWQLHTRALLEHAERTGRSALVRFQIQSTAVGYAALRGEADREAVESVLQPLERACGRDIYDELESLPQAERLTQTFARAQQRFDETPEAERLLPPVQALPLLAQMVIRAIGVMGSRVDHAFFERLTSIEPYVALSPALQVVQWNVEGSRAGAAGRIHVFIDRNTRILERMAQDDRAGLDPVSHRYMGLALKYGLAISCAAYGRPLDADHLAEMDSDPVFAVNACRVRMLAALAFGDLDRADKHRRAAELLRLQDNPPQMFEGSHVGREAAVYAFARDLARLKQCLPEIEKKAEQIEGWRPTLHHAQAMYQLLRGSPRKALRDAEAGLALARAGEHGMFCPLASAQVQVLLELERPQEAAAAGTAHLAAARQADLGPATHALASVLALAWSRLGQHEQAEVLADDAIALLEDFGAGGIPLGGAYEARARVAIAQGEHDAFEDYAARCAEIYRAGRHPLLAARYAELMAHARAERLAVSDELARAAAASIARTMDALTTSQPDDPAERGRLALGTLLGAMGASGGYLYTMQAERPALMAQVGAATPPRHMDELVAQFVEPQLDPDCETQTSAGLTLGTATPLTEFRADDGGHYLPLLLSHETEHGRAITGVALISRDAADPDPSSEVVAAVSRALHEWGDASTMIAS